MSVSAKNEQTNEVRAARSNDKKREEHFKDTKSQYCSYTPTYEGILSNYKFKKLPDFNRHKQFVLNGSGKCMLFGGNSAIPRDQVGFQEIKNQLTSEEGAKLDIVKDEAGTPLSYTYELERFEMNGLLKLKLMKVSFHCESLVEKEDTPNCSPKYKNGLVWEEDYEEGHNHRSYIPDWFKAPQGL